MLKYALYKSNLPASKGKFLAITQVEVTATLEDLIADMTSRGSTVTRAEVVSIWEEFTLAIKIRLGRGENISTPLFYIGQDIQGDFDSEDDSFEPSRNTVVFNIATTEELKKVAADISTQKVAANKPMPVIKTYTDHASNTGTTLTPGNTARVPGQNLKVDTTDATQGVFILGGGAETKIASFIDNQPSTLTFLLPTSLPAGTYELEVRVKLFRSKELRVDRLANTLTVY